MVCVCESLLCHNADNAKSFGTKAAASGSTTIPNLPDARALDECQQQLVFVESNGQNGQDIYAKLFATYEWCKNITKV